MRPLELKMTAFGCYAETTVIPFERLTHGLYLVTGDTGAGKTTIFDAIMFALYGKASGQDRGVDMLHSDYVPLSEDTLVELRFLHDGREYTVRRSIHYPRKRLGPRQYGEPTVDAELVEPDRAPLAGATKVTGRCEALLGLNAEQFRKIIMLAQGEFKEFLKADSDRKADILKKLFDSSAYSWYQNLLCGARDALARQRKGQREALAALMGQGFRAPEGLDEAQGLLYLPEHPALAENLRALVASEEATLAELNRRRDEAQAGIDALNARRGAAEAVNAQLEELEKARARLVGLDGQQADFARRREAMLLAERALRRVRPALEAFEGAGRALDEARAGVGTLEREIESRARDLEAARAEAAGDGGLREEADRLAAELRAIDEQLPLYEALEAMLAKRDGARKAALEANQAADGAQANLERVGEALKAIRDLLDALENVDAEALAAKNADDKARERLEALAGESGLRRAVADLLDRERQLAAERAALKESTLRALEARSAYDGLYARFVAGQAGLLAESLRGQLRRDGEALCPVCGTSLCRDHLPGLARLSTDTPDREAVDRARDEADRMERRRADRYARVEGAEASLASEQSAVVARARRWLPDCDDWTELCAPGYLEAAATRAGAEQRRTADELKRLLADQARRNREKDRLPQAEARKQALEATLKENRDAAQARGAEAAALDAAIAERRSRLAYGDKSQAEAARQGLARDREALVRKIDGHRAALEAARQALDIGSGTLDEKRRALAAQADRLEAARQALDLALREADFADVAAAQAALAPIGGGDGEAWLKAEQAAQHEFESERRSTRAQIDRLAEQTRGKAYVDPEALGQAVARAEALRDEANAACVAMESLLENHRRVLREASSIREALQASEGAWRRIDRLAGLAVGTPGDGGKRSFERYVLSAVFTDILEMANRRLDRMSGGRYELVLRTGADRANAKAGLDVDVLDYSTGQRRPSGSLSGGEAFFTSLSLALGLSDVVQNRAGGRSMDALFIDEGFGTLSDDYLDKAMEVLNQLTEGDRLVGIISHVDKLNESIPQKIYVRSDERGSRVEPIA